MTYALYEHFEEGAWAYTTLGLDKCTSIPQIRSKFNQLARVNHPDKGGDSTKWRKMIEARDYLIKNHDRLYKKTTCDSQNEARKQAEAQKAAEEAKLKAEEAVRKAEAARKAEEARIAKENERQTRANLDAWIRTSAEGREEDRMVINNLMAIGAIEYKDLNRIENEMFDDNFEGEEIDERQDGPSIRHGLDEFEEMEMGYVGEAEDMEEMDYGYIGVD